jgi:hypothetical protein
MGFLTSHGSGSGSTTLPESETGVARGAPPGGGGVGDHAAALQQLHQANQRRLVSCHKVALLAHLGRRTTTNVKRCRT